MQNVITSVANASQVIQLAVAPVFLLTGIGAILSVLTGRLSRVVDRFRVLNEKYGMATNEHIDTAAYKKATNEIHLLQRRAELVHWAITLCTLALLFVAIVIGILFLGSEIRWNSSGLVSLLFIMAMLSLIMGLGFFLSEIQLSKHTFELPPRRKRKVKSTVV